MKPRYTFRIALLGLIMLLITLSIDTISRTVGLNNILFWVIFILGWAIISQFIGKYIDQKIFNQRGTTMESKLVVIYEEDYTNIKLAIERLLPISEPWVDTDILSLQSIVKQYEGKPIERTMGQIKHESLRLYRLDSNPIERIYAEKWKQRQLIGNTLAYLLNNITQRDATVAATIIQWLGSSGGQSFLDEVQEEIKISKEE